ncbi:LacI family DNA-binding transcriptional regulator [Galbitalea soli]|uniref:Substrate-binding domain-containing protein n=1 Tax=Galbitalea soli TaxID=1268042 RepID=A0A7C9PMQ5_9MICO|nr:LacI family DNA-binding transcriptional regulator [Galbitalea soli]NEM91045.1 substrate-binding domain-containing protein [Galbitalea soli]NYJ29733.1 LacI family transcriptional regulator [Galbitalea soli]
MAKRVGISDVATAAGVSVTTVSHALSGQGNLSAKTREHVQRVAGELGYAPNRIASALRRQRSGIVGFVSDEIATTPFAGRIVLGAQDAAAERGLLLMLVNSNRDDRVEAQQIDSLLDQQVDAFVYARMSHGLVSLPAKLAGLPTVVVDAENPDGGAPWVVPDEVGIGRTATERLLAAGHRRIVHISVDAPGPGVDGRILGYRRTMAEHGLEPHVFTVPEPADASAGRETFEAALAAVPDLTAVFCFNDPMAMGVYQIAAERGMCVPDDLSLIGVDNLEVIAAQLRPGLTTVGLPHYEMGRWAIEQLSAMIGDPEWSSNRSQVELACPLIERGSVASPRKDTGRA